MAQTKIILPKLKPWQKAVYDKVAYQGGSGKLFVLKSPRQRGKSVLDNVLITTYALTNKSTSVILEPTSAQARRMHKQLVDWLQKTGTIVSSNSTFLTIEFCNGSEVLLKSAEMEDGIRGFTVSKNGIFIIDEAAFIKDDIFDLCFPIVDANQAPILITSTPLFESGRFYELYMQGLQGVEHIESFDWSTGYDMSEMLPPEKLEYYRKTLPPLKFRSEYLGEFITDKSFVFGDFTKCYGTSTKPPVYAGLDWATGKQDKDDYTSLVLMDEDGAVVDIKFWKVYDPMDLADNIAQILNVTPTLRTVQLEENSIGEVYYSALKRNVKNKSILKPFITSNDSKRRIIEQLIAAFAQEKITIPEDQRLIRQLQGYQMEKLPSGKYTYNAMSGFNDDACIALALAYDLVSKPATKPRFGFA